VSSGVTCAPPKVTGNPQKREVIARETEATAAFTCAEKAAATRRTYRIGFSRFAS
jgi:hypothetical protein